ncbi:MAG: DUF2892 domain-containing protein [Endomicrobiaceae bacterium]|nr:DUF2892 domain-containing protein [Endomicrobiaceae bacterium]
MYQEEFLRMFAGIAVLAGLTLGYWVSSWYFLFVVFVGLNLLQSAFTHWCPAMYILDKCGVHSCRCDNSKEQ